MRLVLLLCAFVPLGSVNGQQIFDNLRALQLGDSIFIQWTLLADYTCNDMLLQRADDGFTFKTVYSISGICGANADVNYQYLDGTDLMPAHTYTYRVTASNGIYESNTVSLMYNNTGEGDLLLFPNPATSHINILINRDLKIPCYAEVVSPDGKPLWNTIFYNHQAEVIIECGSGIYFLRLITDDGMVRYAKCIIQR